MITKAQDAGSADERGKRRGWVGSRPFVVYRISRN